MRILNPTRALAACLVAGTLALGGCSNSNPGTSGVYMLLDTSGTYTVELEKAQKIVNLLLGTLEAGDSLAVARIDSASFSEKDIIARVSFDQRPSTTNAQKRQFKGKVDQFANSTRTGSSHTDITGGLLQAVEWLRETQSRQQTVLIFSDLMEDLQRGHVRDFPIDLDGVRVVALNVTKLRGDNIDPREYSARLAHWRERVEKGGGSFTVINDMDHIGRALTG